MFKLLICLVIVLCSLQSAKSDEIVVGILTFPVDENKVTSSYVTQSYVRYLMNGGARVVPILYNSTEGEIEELFEKVNGVLFTGGPGSPLDFPKVDHIRW